MRILLLAIATTLILGSCSRNQARITGHLIASATDTVYLEKVMPGSVTTADTALLDKKGRFNFKVDLGAGTPIIYNVRAGGDFISLILAPGDNAKIDALGRFSSTSTVEGSPDSERMRELRLILSLGAAKLDSILSAYAKADETSRRRISMEFTDKYYAIKREHVQFIVSDPGSIASVYALYQRMPDDNNLVDGESDMIYYRMVANSADLRYPGSPYVAALKNEIATADSREELASMINEKMKEDAPPFLDLDMPDMYGNKHKLSDLLGKVIILDFWTASMNESKLNNAEMKELYEAYAGRGLEIYQICIDEAKHAWVKAVRDQKLPWICVNDLKGSAGRAVTVYNIRSIPANYIIDRKGQAVARDLYGDELEKKIKQLI